MPVWNQFAPGDPETLLHNYTYWGNLNESNVTSTSYRLDFYGNASSYILVEGTGFQFYYDDNEEHLYNVGSVHSFTLYTSSGYQICQVTDLAMLPFDMLGSLLSTSASTLRSTIDGLAWTFNGTAGSDTIRAGSQADTIYGSAGSDTIYALGGADHIDGGTGADVLYGAGGDDAYYVDNAGDVVHEAGGEGFDTVNSSVNFQAGTAESIEAILLTGLGDINATGNELAQVITGNNGNNILDGRGGADTMSGGAGNDTYWVDNAGDQVVEDNGQGIDAVNSSVSFNMNGQEIENLYLRTSASINGTGNSIANIITGNSGNNAINGLGGNDTLSGAQGHDSFVFSTALNASTNVDTITDFSAIDDIIQVDNAIFSALGGNGTLSADQFVANTSGAATNGSQHIIYETDTGWLYYDSDGNGAGGSTHFATLAANLALTNADFVVV